MSRDFVQEAQDILQQAIERFEPSHVFALFSGGHDSLCAAHVASRHPRFSGCIHINTGTGIEATRAFVGRTCEQQRWPLREYRPPLSYEEIVLRYGFPGPAGHRLVYNRLKERCIRQVVRDHKARRRDHILLVSGVRRAESRRRMGTAVAYQKEGSRVWVAPLVNWTDQVKETYLDSHGLSRNEVVRHLSMSGECLCGAFARTDELALIERFYPEAAARIRELEARAAAAGVPARWGARPRKRDEVRTTTVAGLCWSCAARKDRPEAPLVELGYRPERLNSQS